MEKTIEQIQGWVDTDNIEMDLDSGWITRKTIRECIDSCDGHWSGRYFKWTTPTYSDDEGGYIGGEEVREGFDYKYVE